MSLKQCCALGRCSATKDLKACSACNEVNYCCREHQIEHFKEGGHKMICPGKQKGKVLTFSDCASRAQTCYLEKKWVSALNYYSAMLELTERSVGLFHSQVARLLEVLVTCYKMLDKLEEAIGCLQRVIVILELSGDESVDNNKKLFNNMGRLAEMYLTMGNIKLAKQLLVKTEEQGKEVFGEESFERGRALCALAGCLERNGEVEEAITQLKAAIELKGYGCATEKTEMLAASNGFFNLGVLQLNGGDLPVACTLLTKARDFKLQGGLTVDHPDMVENEQMLAKATA